MSPEDAKPSDRDTETWRERGHRARVYFGLADDEGEKRSEPDAPWWKHALDVVAPLLGAVLLRKALGYDNGFLTMLGLVMACAVAWAVVTGLVGFARVTDGSLVSSVWSSFYLLGASVTLVYSLGDFEDRSSVFIVWTCGGQVLKMGVRKLRERR
jgi:hypothetical protein